MHEFVYDNLQYPEVALKNGVSGRVQVSFVVDVNGKVTDVKIARGKTPELDAEALRIINLLPDFTPGRKNGVPIECKYIMTVVFRLPEE